MKRLAFALLVALALHAMPAAAEEARRGEQVAQPQAAHAKDQAEREKRGKDDKDKQDDGGIVIAVGDGGGY